MSDIHFYNLEEWKKANVQSSITCYGYVHLDSIAVVEVVEVEAIEAVDSLDYIDYSYYYKSRLGEAVLDRAQALLVLEMLCADAYGINLRQMVKIILTAKMKKFSNHKQLIDTDIRSIQVGCLYKAEL